MHASGFPLYVEQTYNAHRQLCPLLSDSTCVPKHVCAKARVCQSTCVPKHVCAKARVAREYSTNTPATAALTAARAVFVALLVFQ